MLALFLADVYFARWVGYGYLTAVLVILFVAQQACMLMIFLSNPGIATLVADKYQNDPSMTKAMKR